MRRSGLEPFTAAGQQTGTEDTLDVTNNGEPLQFIYQSDRADQVLLGGWRRPPARLRQANSPTTNPSADRRATSS